MEKIVTTSRWIIHTRDEKRIRVKTKKTRTVIARQSQLKTYLIQEQSLILHQHQVSLGGVSLCQEVRALPLLREISGGFPRVMESSHFSTKKTQSKV